MNHCIHAYTSTAQSYPSFINISQTVDCLIRVTVRSDGNGGRDVASIDLTPEQLERIVCDATAYLNGDSAPVVTDDRR